MSEKILRSYKLRVTCSPSAEVTERLVKLLKYFSSVYSYVDEVSSKDKFHYHCYLQSYYGSRIIRQHVSDTFGKGNKVYSLKELDELLPLDYLAYMHKDNMPTYSEDFPPECIQLIRLHYDEIKENFLETREKKKPQKIADAILQQYFPEDHPVWLDTADMWYYVERLYESVVDYHIQNDLVIREFQILGIVQTILCKKSETYRTTIFKNKILERLGK